MFKTTRQKTFYLEGQQTNENERILNSIPSEDSINFHFP